MTSKQGEYLSGSCKNKQSNRTNPSRPTGVTTAWLKLLSWRNPNLSWLGTDVQSSRLESTTKFQFRQCLLGFNGLGLVHPGCLDKFLICTFGQTNSWINFWNLGTYRDQQAGRIPLQRLPRSQAKKSVTARCDEKAGHYSMGKTHNKTETRSQGFSKVWALKMWKESKVLMRDCLWREHHPNPRFCKKYSVDKNVKPLAAGHFWNLRILEPWNAGTLQPWTVWLQPKLRTLAPAPAGNLWNPVWGQERHKWRMLPVPKQMFSMLSKKTKLEK